MIQNKDGLLTYTDYIKKNLNRTLDRSLQNQLIQSIHWESKIHNYLPCFIFDFKVTNVAISVKILFKQKFDHGEIQLIENKEYNFDITYNSRTFIFTSAAGPLNKTSSVEEYEGKRSGEKKKKESKQNKYVKHVFPFIDVPFYEYYSNGRNVDPFPFDTFRSIFNCRYRAAVCASQVYTHRHHHHHRHLPEDDQRPKWLQSSLIPCKCHTRVVDENTLPCLVSVRAHFSRSTDIVCNPGHVSYLRDRCCGVVRRTALLLCGERRGRHAAEDVPHTNDRKPHRRPDTQLYVRVVRRHRKQAIRRDKEHFSDDGINAILLYCNTILLLLINYNAFECIVMMEPIDGNTPKFQCKN
ncbi:hypothetical protein AGLY_014997 [Aphis glycines]|uniref:Uncharacterized protein n=1 Tax=Aphis glycines TaxID=307491 RepID=A0A6G0T4W7_APHGL|nr:hypothetical protein AGLY_014997 [Aphis glycines]